MTWSKRDWNNAVECLRQARRRHGHEAECLRFRAIGLAQSCLLSRVISVGTYVRFARVASVAPSRRVIAELKQRVEVN